MTNLVIVSCLIALIAADHAGAQPAPPPAAGTPGEIDSLGRLKWTSTAALINPTSDDAHPIVSIKDPSVVYFNNRWHVYATTANAKGHWSMVYLNFADWADATSAKPDYLDAYPNLRGYHCAPQVFYFTPHKKWYLIFQSQQPQYCTADDLTKPETWTKPVDFFDGIPGSVVDEKWIDYFMIADDTHVYLFFTGDNGRFYRSRTRLEDFPRGMCEPVLVMQEKEPRELFEAGATYRLKGQNKYLTIIECASEKWERYYKAFIADSLDGEWRPVADTFEKPFAGINNVTFQPGVKPWTVDVSHGELIRDGYDQTMTVDPANLQLLYQGRDPASNGLSYEKLPYRLGLLTAEKPR